MHDLLTNGPDLIQDHLKDWKSNQIIYKPGEPDDDGDVILWYRYEDKRIPLLARNELLVVTGPQKSRKTLLLQCMIMSRHSKELNKTFGYELDTTAPVILYDTEQPRRRVRKNIRRYHEVANLISADPKYMVFSIKHMAQSQKMSFIDYTIKEVQDQFGEDPALVLIDQVADLCPSRDVNNDMGVDMILTHLNKWGAETRAAMGTVIHTNRGRLNTNGKLGVMLDQKTDCTFHVDIDFDTWISTVTHKEARGLRIPKFTFRQDYDGHPRLLVVDEIDYNHI